MLRGEVLTNELRGLTTCLAHAWLCPHAPEVVPRTRCFSWHFLLPLRVLWPGELHWWKNGLLKSKKGHAQALSNCLSLGGQRDTHVHFWEGGYLIHLTCATRKRLRNRHRNCIWFWGCGKNPSCQELRTWPVAVTTWLPHLLGTTSQNFNPPGMLTRRMSQYVTTIAK